jgi:hypothetical protein
MYVFACSGDTTTNEATGSGTGGTGPGSGGAGGATGTTTSGKGGATSSGPTTSSGAGGDPCAGITDVCDKGCCKIEKVCKFPVTCAQLGIDCMSMQGQCVGDCIIKYDCGKIATLPTSNPDPEVSKCFNDCVGGGQGGGAQGCVSCIQSQCSMEFMACFGDAKCQAFGNCVMGCGADNCCVQNKCATDSQFASPATDAIIACGTNKCPTECGCMMGTGGAGGGGGGGAGGV